MRSDDFISSVSALAVDEDKFNKVRGDIPLGVDTVGNFVCARKSGLPLSTTRHICVTGVGKGAFIRRLLITLSCLYDQEQICFFVLSPDAAYGELLRFKYMDITVPYLRAKSDLTVAEETLKDLLRLRDFGRGFPKLIVVLDGLEKLEGCNRNGDLEEYRAFLDQLARRNDVELITGVELTKSIFSGYPGAFVGVGNCLVALQEAGKADVTYVQEDASLTLPLLMNYPDSPSITETVLFFNAVSKDVK